MEWAKDARSILAALATLAAVFGVGSASRSSSELSDLQAAVATALEGSSRGYEAALRQAEAWVVWLEERCGDIHRKNYPAALRQKVFNEPIGGGEHSGVFPPGIPGLRNQRLSYSVAAQNEEG